MTDRYTFGDDERAGARLLRLAELHEPVTRELIARGGLPGCGLALDLGWELDALEASLERIAGGGDPEVVVRHQVRQIVAERAPRAQDGHDGPADRGGAA